MTMTLTKAVKKAIVTTCMKHGIEDVDSIMVESVKAIGTVGIMSAAGYKAHTTRKRFARRSLSFRKKA